MITTTVNLESVMLRENRKVLARETAVLNSQIAMDGEVAKLLSEVRETAEHENRVDVMSTLGLDYKVQEATRIKRNNDQWAHLPQDRIFTQDAIRKVCVAYGLRFLPTSLYKGALDEGIAAKLEELKSLNRGDLPQTRMDNSYHAATAPHFFIAAPAESFVLSARPKDPLLFCALGDNRYFLVHKWGSDLSVVRLATTILHRFRIVFLYALIVAITECFAYSTGAKLPHVLSFALVPMISALVIMMFSTPTGMEDSPIFKFFKGSRHASDWNSPFRD